MPNICIPSLRAFCTISTGGPTRTLSKLGERPGAYGDSTPGAALQQSASSTSSLAVTRGSAAVAPKHAQAQGPAACGGSAMPEMDSASVNELQHAVSLKEASAGGASRHHGTTAEATLSCAPFQPRFFGPLPYSWHS